MVRALFVLLSVMSLSTLGCYRLLPSNGGGDAQFSPPRVARAADVTVPAGYEIEVVASGLSFPTGVAFDESGGVYVVESGYSYGEVWADPKLLRVNSDGSTHEIARGTRNGPWNGVSYGDGFFYVAEGGQMEGGRILEISAEGDVRVVIDELPSRGDHHTNGPVIGNDGKIVFAQGTATNAGIVGEDNAQFGWLKRFPRFHDTPCEDISLTGKNFETPDITGSGEETVTTGAYSPFGEPTHAGQVIPGDIPCNGAIMKINPDGTGLELVAWGFRNPYGLAFAPDGQLFATDNAYDDRGSRGVWGTGDNLWRGVAGQWYGWPDYSGGEPLSGGQFDAPGEPELNALLQDHPASPPEPVAILGVHASANGLDFSHSPQFGFVGQAFIAEFGDQAPDTGKSLHPVGFRVVRVDISSGHVQNFAVNDSTQSGPASKIGNAGLERPIAARFDPSGEHLYVVDFGVMLMSEQGPEPQLGTGVLWKISRRDAP